MRLKARREIVSAVTSKMVNYCKKLSSAQTEVVASKIVLALWEIAKDCM